MKILPFILLISISTTLSAEPINYDDDLNSCDGVDRKGIIHIDEKDGKIKGVAENRCVRKLRVKKLNKKIKGNSNEKCIRLFILYKVVVMVYIIYIRLTIENKRKM